MGDPRQLQAVGRGGMFDELCRTSRVHELATIHRFRHPWEQTASLQLRHGDTDAIDAYIDHGRVDTGTFDNLVHHIGREWTRHTTEGRTVAVVAETNDHVDQLNAAIQQHRRDLGELGRRTTGVAGNETVAAGDLVVTRRNDRTLLTDRGEPVRNRDLWHVDTVRRDGCITVTHTRGHGRVTLPANYAQAHVRLGYAATAHGHQGDTVDIGLAVITASTTHRSLYVAATRGRDENRLLVVTDDPSEEAARDVLGQAITNDRADTPAIAQRRHLATTPPRTEHGPVGGAHEELTAARLAATHARTAAAPFTSAVAKAEDDLREAQRVLRSRQHQLADAKPWHRRQLRDAVADNTVELEEARARLDEATVDAAPFEADLQAAQERVLRAEIETRRARLQATIEREVAPRHGREIEIDDGIDIGL